MIRRRVNRFRWSRIARTLASHFHLSIHCHFKKWRSKFEPWIATWQIVQA